MCIYMSKRASERVHECAHKRAYINRASGTVVVVREFAFIIYLLQSFSQSVSIHSQVLNAVDGNI
jgi:hypothetical protein